jgi:hypothetical protein
MPEYVALSNTSKEFGEDSSTDGEDGDEEGTLHLLFQNRRLSNDFSKKVCFISITPLSLYANEK